MFGEETSDLLMKKKTSYEFEKFAIFLKIMFDSIEILWLTLFLKENSFLSTKVYEIKSNPLLTFNCELKLIS